MTKSAFAVALRKAREDKGLTQRDLASKMGMTQQAIGRWEAGRGIPNVTSLGKLRELLGAFDEGIDRRDERPVSAPVVTREPRVTDESPREDAQILETRLGTTVSFDYLSDKLAVDIIDEPPRPRYELYAAALWKLSCSQIICGGRREFMLLIVSPTHPGLRTERRVVLEASLHNLSVNFVESRDHAMQLISQIEHESTD